MGKIAAEINKTGVRSKTVRAELGLAAAEPPHAEIYARVHIRLVTLAQPRPAIRRAEKIVGHGRVLNAESFLSRRRGRARVLREMLVVDAKTKRVIKTIKLRQRNQHAPP